MVPSPRGPGCQLSVRLVSETVLAVTDAGCPGPSSGTLRAMVAPLQPDCLPWPFTTRTWNVYCCAVLTFTDIQGLGVCPTTRPLR